MKEHEEQNLNELNIKNEENNENEKNDDGLMAAMHKAGDELNKKYLQKCLKNARETEARISEMKKKNGPASAVYDVKINLLNEEGKTPYYKTVTDETIDEAAALFDKLFSDDAGYLSDPDNFRVNNKSLKANAIEIGKSMGLDVREIDFSSDKGIKFQKALFIHAIADKNSKITVYGLDKNGNDKNYEIKLPEKTDAQMSKEETARALVEEDRKHFNGMREDEIPGFVKLEKDIYESRNDICSLSFNSKKARNDPDDLFNPCELSKEEYDKALDLYEKVFKNYKDQKGLITVGGDVLYTKLRSLGSDYFTFVVNGKRMTSEGYLKNVTKMGKEDVFFTENDKKVTTIYLMTRYQLTTRSLDGKIVDFQKVAPDMEPPKDIIEEAGKALQASDPEKVNNRDAELNDNPINDPEKVPVRKSVQEKGILAASKNKNGKISKYDLYATNAVLPDIIRTPEMKIDAISKVMAAHALKTAGIGYDVKKIETIEKHFKELFCLDDLKTHPQIDKAATSVDIALRFGEMAKRNLYTVQPEQYKNYSEEMKALLINMQSKNGRTNEYKELYDAVKEASELQEKTALMGKAEKASAYRNSNIKVVEAVRKYSKGKKSVRTITSRKDRFDNGLDALAIVVKTTPNSARRINKMIADINTHRNAANKIDIKSFTTSYGADRAKTRGVIYSKSIAKDNKKMRKMNPGLKSAM